ncbi:hypothetical protein SUGI_0245380 [Cryptomeria japonica]|nr:hypothetical protein SUGI_0245380 [Cryptomeria japonica]
MGKHWKWQDIMVLEVQDVGEDLCATIPLGRLDAFIRGESLHEGVETQFLRKYWCSYGPKYNRKKSPNKKCTRTYQKKRGCTCHFIVKVLYGRPDLAILILKQPLHVDKNGEACHGMDHTNNELRSQFAPNFSDECKAYIERFLLMDVSVDAIMDRHLGDPIFHDMLKKRDSFVTRKDLMNATTRVSSIWSRKHVHDATSILEWKKQDEAKKKIFQPLQGVDKPFIMGIQMAWMLDMMVRFSHDSIISMDSTFATNKYGQSGLPIAWVVTSRNKIKDIQVWSMELRKRGKEKRPNWRINAFIIDDASEEIQAID